MHDAYGAHDESETLYVEIPGGIDNNETIVLPTKGNVVGRAVGDVKVFIEVSKDSNFQRDALDLIHTRPITLKEALCGFSFQLRHLDGQKFQLNNERGNLIGPGSRKVLKGLGMAEKKKPLQPSVGRSHLYQKQEAPLRCGETVCKLDRSFTLMSVSKQLVG